MKRDSFLRSINITFDAADADRVAHYFPTQKSVSLLRKLLGREDERALFVVAPYGSGKSLVGAYALHTAENRAQSRPVLKELNERMANVDSDQYEWQKERITKWSRRGLVIPLDGFKDDLVRALLSSALSSFDRLEVDRKAIAPLKKLLGADNIELLEALNVVKDCVYASKLDGVLILWDEFGRHLETLIAEGRSSELADLQTIAEFVSRQRKIPFSISLFLHQGLLDYASNLPQIVRREWKKVEGRFATVDYVEDSKEIYRLIGEIMSSIFSKDDLRELPGFAQVSKRLLTEGRFQGFKQRELASLLRNAYPLSPTALELLPRISARVSQNERTLFSFLFQLKIDAQDPLIDVDVLFDYFSDQMQADVEVGGTHRQWLETQSALSKVAGDCRFETAIKGTCLLGLGLSGERTRATKKQVTLALAGYGEEKAALEVLDELIDRKLLLHRKHSDEVSVWHGADLDLRGRLNESKRDLEAGFDLVQFLTKEASPPTWKPQEYNDTFCVTRYFRSEFVELSQLEETGNFSKAILDKFVADISTDGWIFYVLANSKDDAARAESLIGSIRDSKELEEVDGRVTFIMPVEPLSILDSALEVAALVEMEQDRALVDQDPLLLPELRQMLDDARAHFQQLVDRLTLPDRAGSIVHYFGEKYEIRSSRLLRRLLSNISGRVFNLTPKLKNELIVRKKVPGTVVNSRKKLLLGITDRYGEELFGITGNFPDAAIARTVLVQTGLYRRNGESRHWSFAAPKEINDPGLKEIWGILENFFTSPSVEGKAPADLLIKLSSPPYGVRPALFPILFAAGLKAFAYSTSLLEDEEYIADIMPSHIESLCKNPSRYKLRVFELSLGQEAYLNEILELFSVFEFTDGEDIIRNAYDGLQAWLQALPPAALSTRRISNTALQFRSMLSRNKDPVALLLESIPSLVGISDYSGDIPELSKLKEVKVELESVINRNRDAAIAAVLSALGVKGAKEGEARGFIRKWAESFSGVLPNDHHGKPLILRMCTGYASDYRMIDSIAAAVGRVSLPRWEDEDADAFEIQIKRLVDDIEEAVLGSDLAKIENKEVAESISSLLLERISLYADKLRVMGHEDKIYEFLSQSLEMKKK